MPIKKRTRRRQLAEQTLAAQLKLDEVDIIVRLKKRELEMLSAIAKTRNMDHKILVYEFAAIRIVEEYGKIDKIKRFFDAKVD